MLSPAGEHLALLLRIGVAVPGRRVHEPGLLEAACDDLLGSHLEERLKQLESEIPKLQAELDFAKIQYLSSDEIVAEAKDLHARWPDLGFEDKRKILENITERIVIGKDDVTIDLCYLPSASEIVSKGQRNIRDSSPRPA